MAEEGGTSSVNKWELQEVQFTEQFEQNKEKRLGALQKWSSLGQTGWTAHAALARSSSTVSRWRKL